MHKFKNDEHILIFSRWLPKDKTRCLIKFFFQWSFTVKYEFKSKRIFKNFKYFNVFKFLPKFQKKNSKHHVNYPKPIRSSIQNINYANPVQT